MKTELHKADSRGKQDHGWLKANHTFSFGGYYNPSRVHFGTLRVLNDDYVQGGMGFGMHPHANMEIITIPLSGELHHKDSMGNFGAIRKGEIQVMSAGTGVEHSEFNGSETEPVTLLQIWVIPSKLNVEPRYDQLSILENQSENKFQQIISPNPDDDGSWIYQDAWFHLGYFSGGKDISYQLKKNGNGVYLFLISGIIYVNGTEMSSRDGLAISETEFIEIKVIDNAEILLMEVPMQLPKI